MRRVLTAAVLLPVLVMIVHFGSIELFVIVTLVAVAIATDEASRMFSNRGGHPFRLLAVLGGLSLVLAQAYGEELKITPSGVWWAFLVATPIAAMGMRKGVERMADSTYATLLPVTLVAWPMSTLVLIRLAPMGQRWIYLLFICTILADTAAYYTGRTWGEKKLAPAISPKKTWIGAFGGMAAAILGGLGGALVFLPEVPPADAALLGGAMGFAAILGDLMESMWKRHAAIKDSSSLLPGHGGLLDRIDSLLFAAPVLLGYLWLQSL